jgi:hypothetical protein
LGLLPLSVYGEGVGGRGKSLDRHELQRRDIPPQDQRDFALRFVVQEAVRAGVSELPGELSRREAQIQGHQHSAGASDGVDGDDERSAVSREHAKYLSRPHALAAQMGDCRVHSGVEVSKGQAVRAAEKGEPVGRRLGAVL